MEVAKDIIFNLLDPTELKGEKDKRAKLSLSMP
jgi:hypothetical protein